MRKRCVEEAAPARDGGNGRILTLRRASGEASLMNDGLLGPRLTLGHGAPMLKRGLAAGAVAFRLFCHNDEKVSSSNDPHRRGGRGPDLPETKPVSLSNDPPRRGGRGPDLPETIEGYPQRRKKESTKGHEERRRATKGLEKAQEGSTKGREGRTDFHHGR